MDFELDVEEFGMALGFGDEMSRGEMDGHKARKKREKEEEEEMEELVDLQEKLEAAPPGDRDEG